MKVHPDHGNSDCTLVQIAVDIFQQKLMCRTLLFFTTNFLSMLPFIGDKQ